MELFIHKYLSNHYVVSTTEESGKKIQVFVNYGIYVKTDEKVKEFRYVNHLIDELVSVFSISEVDTLSYICSWVEFVCPRCDLTWYWKQEPPFFPHIKQVVSRTVAMDLVAVQPMSAPTGMLCYFDYVYSGDTPDINGRVYDKKAINKVINDSNQPEEKSRQSWGDRLYSKDILQLIENQKKELIGISSRKRND